LEPKRVFPKTEEEKNQQKEVTAFSK
jgi:hypothetical protein